jgi:CRP/FNR family transcriptional regulator, anaerobic regulatory protein
MDSLKSFLQQKVSISEEEWNAFEAVLQTKTVKKKEHFLQEGQICKQIGFIVSGYVRLYYLKDGEEITKDFNFENMFCGSYASFSLQQPSLFNIIAMEDVELITFGRDDLYTLADRYSSIERMLRKNMEFMFIRKELREASFLLDDAQERYRKLLEQEPQMIQRVPLKHLASYLGLSAETLSRVRRLM